MSSVAGIICPGRIITVLALGIALAFCLQPVLAADERFTITYRGAGGYYVGDTIIFDGINKAGNLTLLKITGPDLPAEGVPVYDLDGAAGTGNPVEVNSDGTWRFAWYTSSIKNLDKMQTARYKIIAFDSKDPTATATISVMMKKPDFYVVASPSVMEKGEYLRLIGTAEQGTTDIHIEISDSNGKVVRTDDTDASQTGYFTYAFHVDMDPGVYYVTVTSPTVRTTYRTTITVIPPQSSLNATADISTTSPANQPAITSTTGTLSISSTPSGASVYVDSAALGSTPITKGDIAPGTHLVEIKNPGYTTYTAYAVVKAGEVTTVSPALTKNASFLPLSPLSALAGLVIAAALIGIAATSRRTR